MKIGKNTVKAWAAIIAVVAVILGLSKFGLWAVNMATVAEGAILLLIIVTVIFEFFLEEKFQMNMGSLVMVAVVIVGIMFAVGHFGLITIPTVLLPIEGFIFLILALIIFYELFVE